MTTTPPSRRGPVPAHVAWVARRARGRPEAAGREDRALLALVETALDLGVAWLTVQDPSGGRALRERTAELARRGIGVACGSGRAGDGPAGPVDLVRPEEPTLRVLLAEEGCGRQELVGAVRELAARGAVPKDVSEASISSLLEVPDVDLLVLTGDDRRVPDLLIWQVAYSEIVVLPAPWPEAAEAQLHAAIGEYWRRDRRYGGVVAAR